MTRILAPHVSIETAVLGMADLIISFVLIHAMLSVSGLFGVLAPGAYIDVTASGLLAAILALTIAGIAGLIGLYRPEVCLDPRSLVRNAATAGLCAFPALLLIARGFSLGLGGREAAWIAQLLAGWLLVVMLSRLALGWLTRLLWSPRRILVVGSRHRALRLSERLRRHRRGLFQPLIMDGDAATLSPDMPRGEHIWGLVSVGDAAGVSWLPSAVGTGKRHVRVFDEPTFSEQHLGRIDIDAPGLVSAAAGIGANRNAVYLAGKRFCDIIVSLLLLALTLPLMALTAVLIRIDSPGPVIYRQTRAGLQGQPFMLFKFRSMTVDAEAGGSPRWAQTRDPRITRVGAWIRPMRIDELPQLINVLRGDMSLIGPRPERPLFVEQLSQVIPCFQQRSCVKPGVTGWAQVNFPYGASVDDAREKLAYDLYYIKHQGFLLDLMILLSTVRVVLFREGAR
ncbi:MAG: exopolysaccharide biosynthesis polyprenyl glycosylphosphotransferase [Acetobacteraceae bacterium]